MSEKLIYVELKTGYNNNGPAYIGKPKLSKSGASIYFNGKCFKKLGGQGISANYFDIETREEYWISGVKKDGKDRLVKSNAKIFIDKECVDEYCNFRNVERLTSSVFEIISFLKADVTKFTELENQ